MDETDLFSGVVPFVHVAEARSFRRAAERLGVTPAAVSKSVARLEGELGVRLLHRTTRRVSLSPEGELFLTRCREAMAEVRTGRAQVALSRRMARGPLRVSLSFVLGPFLASRLPRFLARYPALNVTMRLTDRLSRLVDEEIDVALRIGALRDSSLVRRKVMPTRWATVASSAYLAARGAPSHPRDLATHDCLRFRLPRGRLGRWTFRARPGGSDTISIDPPGRLILDQGDLLVDAAVAGAGIAHVFGFMVEDLVREGRLIELLPEYAAAGPAVHAVCLPGQQRAPRVRAFLDFVAELGRAA